MGFRLNRLAEEIKREVTDIIRTTLKDPRISPLTSITDVEISKDMRYAKIFISIYGSEEEQTKTLEGLKSANGFIRSELGKRIRLRYMPEIAFILDTSIEHGVKISQIIDNICDENRNEET